MDNINWNDVQDEIRRPVPGGYAAKITKVEDNTDKKCLVIEWEFAEGEFKGCNQETFDSNGFWPMIFYKSYKPTALRFFKGFKTSVEMSNRNFVFNNDFMFSISSFDAYYFTIDFRYCSFCFWITSFE